MERDEYEVMYRIEDGFWWYRGLHDWVRRELPPGAHLDAGCGTGRLLELCSRDARPLGVDLSAHALEFTRRRGAFPLARASLTALPFAGARFDVVTSCDVLSEIGAPGDAAALAEINRVLKPGGRLILNLPAYPWLASQHDRAVNTQRRYRAGEVRALLTDAGLTVRRLSYRVCALFPVIAAVRLWQRLAPAPPAVRSDLAPVTGLLDRLLSFYLTLENRLITSGFPLPFGLSISAVAEKPG